MFERFTDRARRVLVLAQEEARLLNHNFIGTEHLLLGLIHEGEGVAARALAALGISLDAVRAQVEETVGPSGESPMGSPPFTPRAKKVLELSLREALQMGHNYIGTEHILLGVVREGEGVAAQVLVALGADLPLVRHQVVQLLSGHGELPQSRGPVTGGGSRAARFLARARTKRPPNRPAGGRPKDSLSTVGGEVQLAYRDGTLTGTLGDERVDLALDVPSSEGSAEGTFAGTEVIVTWRLAANGLWQPDVPASLHGTCGGEPVRLLGWFRLPDLSFDHGTVEGDVAGEPVSVYIEPADRYGDTGSFAAHGDFGGAGFSVRGAVGDHGQLEGSVDGRSVHLWVSRVDGGTRARTLTGSYEGPVPLLLVLCGALLFFT